MKTLYLAPHMHFWDDISVEVTTDATKQRVSLQDGIEGSSGFAMLFDSMEALLERYPHVSEADVLTIRTSQVEVDPEPAEPDATEVQ